MKKIIFVLTVISFTFFSCKKDPTPATVPDTTGYMSYTPNSTWNYTLTNNIAPSSLNYTITSTDRDSSINGKAYHVFTNSTTGSQNQYYNTTGNDYYTFRSLPTTLGGAPIENIYLKDNVAINDSWNQSYSISVSSIPITIKIINTITEKGTLTVNGIAYTDVIHVTTTLQVSAYSVPLPAGAITTDIQSYYAKKVGLVESKNKIDVSYAGLDEHVDEHTVLKSSDIK